MLKILALTLALLQQPAPVTMTSIEHIEGSDSLITFIRFNYDLLLRDYQQTINDDIGIQELRNFRIIPEDMAISYINSKVLIYNDKKLLPGRLLSIEKEGKDVNIKILYRVPRTPRKITIRNIMLTGLFAGAENLTIIKIRNIEKGVKFTQADSEKTFIFD